MDDPSLHPAVRLARQIEELLEKDSTTTVSERVGVLHMIAHGLTARAIRAADREVIQING